MLSVRENFLETTKKDGKPDRFVKQYEFMKLVYHPIMFSMGGPAKPGDMNVKNAWGVTISWAPDQPGMFPNHSADKIVIQDIEHWQDYVHKPNVKLPEEAWQPFIEQCEAIDRDNYYIAPFMAPGIFEQTHYLGEIKNTLINLYEYPDEMHDLIKLITEFEIEEADEIIKHVHPNGLFHHDDWGTQISTFMSPDMFAEFFLEPYKEVYGYWKENGVECITHHADCFAATLVPYMIEMGIDVWQGCMTENNIPELIKKYDGQITFMGDINSAKVDFPGWTAGPIISEVKRACDECGPHSFIPCQTMGGDYGLQEGMYQCIDEEIDKYSKVYWDEHNLEPKAF